MMPPSRRTIIQYSSALLASVGVARVIGANNAETVALEMAMANILAYDDLGWHRTGSETDHLTQEWLAEKIKLYGGAPYLKSYTFDAPSAYQADIRTGNVMIEGMPQYDSGFPSEETKLGGRLGAIDSGADFVVVKSPPHEKLPGYQSLAQARRRSDIKAIVAIIDGSEQGAQPGFTPMNAEYYTEPFGPPVIQVSENYGEVLLKLAAEQAYSELTLSLTKKPSKLTNVYTTIVGRQPSLDPVIVLTPTSGWWHCASERGGGIALWLHLLAHARQGLLNRTVIFAATSGHELGHLGSKMMVSDSDFGVEKVHAWLHLGASFCGKSAHTILQASNDTVRAKTLSSMQKHGIAPQTVVSGQGALAGEIKDVLTGDGTQYISISGINPWFHNKADRAHISVSADRVKRMLPVVEQWLAILDE